jgi:ABC-type uncharacterized transport system permease subunit
MIICLNSNIIHNISTKNYDEHAKLQKKIMIADVKRIFIHVCNSYLFYAKTQENQLIAIQTIYDNELLKTLKNIIMRCDDK